MLIVSFVLSGSVHPVCKTLVGLSETIMQGEAIEEATHREAGPGNLPGRLVEQPGHTRRRAGEGARSLAQTCPCAPSMWKVIAALWLKRKLSSQVKSPTHLPNHHEACAGIV